MAVVETPDRIMTTGGWGDNGGGGWMMLMFMFLFLFRGRDGFGGGGEGCGEWGGGRYTRYDADFREQRYESYSNSKEAIRERYEAMLRQQECCCKTNGNIDSVRCEVKEQGELTRALMKELELKEQLCRKDEKIIELSQWKNRDEIIDGVVRRMKKGGD